MPRVHENPIKLGDDYKDSVDIRNMVQQIDRNIAAVEQPGLLWNVLTGLLSNPTPAIQRFP